MLIFREFFNTQSDQNILQNEPNCTTFSKFLRGASIMSLNSPAYACNYNFYMKIIIFLFKIISKYIPKRINYKFFKKFLYENNYYPITIVYLKYLFFYIIAKLHHFKKFSRGSMPPNPP